MVDSKRVPSLSEKDLEELNAAERGELASDAFFAAIGQPDRHERDKLPSEVEDLISNILEYGDLSDEELDERIANFRPDTY